MIFEFTITVIIDILKNLFKDIENICQLKLDMTSEDTDI